MITIGRAPDDHESEGFLMKTWKVAMRQTCLCALILCVPAFTGCVCKIQVVSHDGGKGPHGGHDFTNGAPHRESIEMIRVDDSTYTFASKTTVTPRIGPFRVHLTSAEAAPSPPCAPEVYPDFVVHHEPTRAMDPVTIEFASPPSVEFVSGWSYFLGKAPIGKTRRVRAIGSGTEMIVRVDADADYVYLIGEALSKCWVYARQEDGSETDCGEPLTVGQYVRIEDVRDASGRIIRKCGTPTTYSDGGAHETFVRDVLDKINDQPW